MSHNQKYPQQHIQKVADPFPFRKANMQALKKRYPHYFDMVNSEPNNPDYELEPTKGGITGLHIKSTDKHIYEMDNPKESISKNIESFDLRAASHAVFLGFGLGYETASYMHAYSDKCRTEHILIIENDLAMFKLAMHIVDYTPIINHPRVTLMLGIPEEHLFTEFQAYIAQENRYYNALSYVQIYNFNVYERSKGYYDACVDRFKEAMHYAVNNYGNDAEDSLLGVENMMNNIGYIINNPGINMLKDKFKGKPAVCIATGPSLDKNKHLLKGLEDKALLISADASLKILLQMGLKPHIVTTLEREMAVVQLFEGIQAEQVSDVYLAACPVVYKEVYETYPGPNIIVYRKFDHFKWLEVERGMLDIKYSAGNMSFKIAEYLGCDPIILIGQDLALSADGKKTNAAGATLGDEQVSYLNEVRMLVDGNDGKQIETTGSLRLFLQAFNIDVSAHNGKVINATEGGAKITKTEVMTFAEAISKYVTQPINPLGLIKDILSEFHVEADAEQKINDKKAHTIASLQTMMDNCDKGLACVQSHKEELLKLKETANDKRASELSIEILKFKQDLQIDKETWQLMFAHIGQSYFLNHEIYIRGFKYPTYAQKVAAMLLEHEEYFPMMKDIMRTIITIIK